MLLRADGDPSKLVHAGPPWSDVGDAPDSLSIVDASKAFDGQFYYRIAVAPWSNAAEVAGVTFDIPSLRAARWAYGAAGYALSGGVVGLVPWGLLVCNVLAMAAIGLIGGAFAQDAGRKPWNGVVCSLWPGFAYSISLDTAELLASAFLLGALLMARRRHAVWCAVLMVLAILTRDTVVVAIAGVGCVSLWRRLRAAVSIDARASSALIGSVVVAAGAFIGWQLTVWARFGRLPLASSADVNLQFPLVAAAEAAHRMTGSLQLLDPLSLLTLVAVIASATAVLRRSLASGTEKLGFLFSVALVLMLSAYPWSGATSFMRASTELGVLGTIILLGTRSRAADTALGGIATVWLVTMVSQILKI